VPRCPLISVIIPTYGRSQLLHDAIASVLQQTITDWECLVVDDASPDRVDTPSDQRVSVIRRGVNEGTAAARNTGIDAARGRHVTFLDDDDLFTPDRLELSLIGQEGADVSVCWARYVDGPARRGRMLQGNVSDALLESVIPNMGQTTVRREVIKPFDERLRCCEDVEWWIRTSQASEVSTVPHCGLLYRRHDGPRHLKSAEARARARAEIMGWHETFFAARPKSTAFQWKRIGLTLAAAGSRSAARIAFTRSFGASASVTTLLHLGRTLWPANSNTELSG
jgi:glycosyltransferase involved in cell wall biosynthesis